MAESPKSYETWVKRIAIELARVRKLEKGGKIHTGWLDARMQYLDVLRQACEQFPGMDFDLADDASRMLLIVKDRSRKKRAEQE